MTLESAVNFPFCCESSSVPSLRQSVPVVFHGAVEEGDVRVLSSLPWGDAPAEGLPGAEGLWEAMSRSQGCMWERRARSPVSLSIPPHSKSRDG